MEIIVKVKAAAVKDPAAHVDTIVRAAGRSAAPQVEVEEVFPGLRTGHSAGTVSLVLPDDLPDAELQQILRALKDDRMVEYAERPSPRTAR